MTPSPPPPGSVSAVAPEVDPVPVATPAPPIPAPAPSEPTTPTRASLGILPRSMPILTRVHYRRELLAWFNLTVLIGAIEGGVVGVIAKTGFEGVVDPNRLNYAVAILSAAPAFANVTSFVWAGLARGRNPIRFLVMLQVLAVLLVSQVAFAPRSALGLGMLMLAAVGGRICWSGVVTLRATVWRANYPRHLRPTIAGRIATLQGLMLTLTALGIATTLQKNEDAYRIVYPAAGAVGLLGALAYSRMRLRGAKSMRARERRELEADRAPDANGRQRRAGLISPRRLIRILAEDAAFRRYMIAMFVFGIGNLSVAPVVVIVLRDVFGYAYWEGILIASIIPTSVMMVAVPFWSRLLDRMHIVQWRAIHCWSFIGANALFLLGATMHLPALLWAGAVAKGIGIGGGVLGWNLGHHDFAPPERTSDYMGVHVTLTGIRGMIGPLAIVTLYQAVERWTAPAADPAALPTDPAPVGDGRWVLALCVALSLVGGLMFVAMRRTVGGDLRD